MEEISHNTTVREKEKPFKCITIDVKQRWGGKLYLVQFRLD